MQQGVLRHFVQTAVDDRVGMTRVALLVCVLAFGCAHSPASTQTAPRLQVIAQPDDARVYVDDAYFGSARVLSAQPKALAPGLRRVTVQASGYFPHDLEVKAKPGTTKIEISLRPIPN